MSEPLIVKCPSCSKRYKLPEKFRGGEFSCRNCETPIDVPKADVRSTKPSRATSVHEVGARSATGSVGSGPIGELVRLRPVTAMSVLISGIGLAMSLFSMWQGLQAYLDPQIPADFVGALIVMTHGVSAIVCLLLIKHLVGFRAALRMLEKTREEEDLTTSLLRIRKWWSISLAYTVLIMFVVGVSLVAGLAG